MTYTRFPDLAVAPELPLRVDHCEYAGCHSMPVAPQTRLSVGATQPGCPRQARADTATAAVTVASLAPTIS